MKKRFILVHSFRGFVSKSAGSGDLAEVKREEKCYVFGNSQEKKKSQDIKIQDRSEICSSKVHVQPPAGFN